jgi:hypothetical protein
MRSLTLAMIEDGQSGDLSELKKYGAEAEQKRSVTARKTFARQFFWL